MGADTALNANISSNYHYTFNFISGLFSQPKYFPLILTSAGIDIELHLADTYKIGAVTSYTDGTDAAAPAAGAIVTATIGTGPVRNYPDQLTGGAAATPSPATKLTYKIENFQYVANLIDLDEEFNMQMRQMMQSMGGILSLPATHTGTFKPLSNLAMK